MKTNKQVLRLLGLYGAIFLFPYIGAWIKYDGELPADLFAFPPLVAGAKAPFSLPVFITIAIIFLVLILFYIVPGLFGFKKNPVAPKAAIPKVKLPVWFWAGLLIWASTLFVMAAHLSEPKWLINWAAIPLYWGFTLILDGWVYVRTGGKSIAATSLPKLIGIGVASISGWLIFEYLNFFVAENWVYPKGTLIPVSEFTLYAVLGSSGLLPLVFEWYSLFNTFDKFRNKYTKGIVIVTPKWITNVLLVVFFAALFAITFFPDGLFGILWVAPMFILAIALDRFGIWTPFTPLKKGNWAPMMLMALAYLVQGFLCECWNYLSATHANGALLDTHNPDYWTYSVPYVNVLHVFEMPLLGFSGYLPFGVYCGIWWISFAFLLNIPTDLHQDEHQKI
jgi:hypothetical protein